MPISHDLSSKGMVFLQILQKCCRMFCSNYCTLTSLGVSYVHREQHTSICSNLSSGERKGVHYRVISCYTWCHERSALPIPGTPTIHNSGSVILADQISICM